MFSFTEAERKKILSVTQSLPATIAPSGTEVLRRLEQLKHYEVSWALHMSSLAEYAKAQRIPRGLRINLQPALFKDNLEFRQKWQGILNRCSLNLITLNVQQLQMGMKDLKQEIYSKEEEYSRIPETNNTLLQDLEVKMERLQQEILQVKLRKFMRDTRDYEKGEVYSWKEARRATCRFCSSSRASYVRASEQPFDEVQSSPASSRGTAVSFLGEGHKPRSGKPGGGIDIGHKKEITTVNTIFNLSNYNPTKDEMTEFCSCVHCSSVFTNCGLI